MDGAGEAASVQVRTVEDYARSARADYLCAAISVCHPQDAVQIMAAALEDMAAGMPEPPFLSVTRSDAQWWADLATPVELEAYAGAALRVIGQRAWGLGARKRLLVHLWQGLPEDERRKFVARVDPAGKFRGRA